MDEEHVGDDLEDAVYVGAYSVRDRGRGMMTVALPRPWREALHLHAGDTVQYYQRPGSRHLIVVAHRRPDK